MSVAVKPHDLAGVPRNIKINDEGEIGIIQGGIEDTGNSSNISLGANETFVGDAIGITDVGFIYVNVYTDKQSIENGLKIYKSSDGINNWYLDEQYTIFANDPVTYAPQPNRAFMKIEYTNGSSAQGMFDLQVILKKTNSLQSSHKLENNVNGQDDVLVVKSVPAYADTNDNTYNNVSIQNPFPVDGDSVYAKDIWEDESDIGDFSGSITDLFDNLHSVVSDVTSNNPKEILIHFNRTIISNAIGLGAYSGNFSNVEIQILTSGDVFTTVFDESSIDTKYTSRTFQFSVTPGFNGIKIKFHTTDTITLSNLVITKSIGVIARQQAAKPDGTIVDINATAGGNLKVSVEELESGISSNSNSQLNTTVFDSTGLELNIDPTTGAVCKVDYAHCEIHEGSHFFSKDYVDLANGATYDILVVVPDTTKWPHFLFTLDSEAEGNMILYAGVTASSNGTPLLGVNRNGNSLTANTTTMFHTPTITDLGVQIARYIFGSGKQVGGDVRANNEQVLTQGSKFLARITNNTTSNNWMNYLADWYEHVNK